MRYFLIAGEASGDALGGALMGGLRRLDPDARFAGVGGPQMQAQGLQSLFPMDELSVMGIAEVLPRYRALKRRIAQTAEEALRFAPDALITIDSPDFTLRVARKVREAAADATQRPHMVHYVAPSVWAWRPGRAAKMARWIDQVLALLPFEPPYMEAAGMRCDFVGHPIAAWPPIDDRRVSAFRAEHAPVDEPLLLALPGSRSSEVRRLAPVFGQALGALAQLRKSKGQSAFRVIVPAAPGRAAMLREALAAWPVPAQLLEAGGADPKADEARKRLAFAAADLALAASGTVSLELSAAATPMVIAHDMAWLSWQIMSRMALVDTVTLPNLITQSRAIPEFLGPRCQPEPIAREMNALLEDQGRRRYQQDIMAQSMQALGRGGEDPGLRAARAIQEALKERGMAGK